MYLAITKYKPEHTLTIVREKEDVIEKIVSDTVERKNTELLEQIDRINGLFRDVVREKGFELAKEVLTDEQISEATDPETYVPFKSDLYSSELLLLIPLPQTVSEDVSQMEFYIEDVEPESKPLENPAFSRADSIAIMIMPIICLLQGSKSKVLSFDLGTNRAYVNISDVRIDFSIIQQMYNRCGFFVMGSKIEKQTEPLIPPFPKEWIDAVPQKMTDLLPIS